MGKSAANLNRPRPRPRRPPRGEAGHCPDDPKAYLCLGVIYQAAEDWRRCLEDESYVPESLLERCQEFGSLRDELLAFFHSQWFAMLCEAAGLSPNATRKALRVA